MDNELSQTGLRGALAFRGAVTTAEGEDVRTGFVPSKNKKAFYHCRCDSVNKNNDHLMGTYWDKPDNPGAKT